MDEPHPPIGPLPTQPLEMLLLLLCRWCWAWMAYFSQSWLIIMFIVALMQRVTLLQLIIVYSAHTTYALRHAILPVCNLAVPVLHGLGGAPMHHSAVMLLRAVFSPSMDTATNKEIKCPASRVSGAPQIDPAVCACFQAQAYAVLVAWFASIYFAYRQDSWQRYEGWGWRVAIGCHTGPLVTACHAASKAGVAGHSCSPLLPPSIHAGNCLRTRSTASSRICGTQKNTENRGHMWLLNCTQGCHCYGLPWRWYCLGSDGQE